MLTRTHTHCYSDFPQCHGSIGKLTALQTLMLTSNALVRMPLNLRLLTNLVEFDATGNPDMDLPPVAVVEQVAYLSM